jgi:hypothetical protein
MVGKLFLQKIIFGGIMISLNYVKRAILTASISIALISIGAAIAADNALEKYRILENEIRFTEVSGQIHRDEGFYIKEHGEIIGVFDKSGKLLYTVEIYTKMLPASDRALLKEGIAARDREELYEILGDYDA